MLLSSPKFIPLWAYQTWNQARTPEIEQQDVIACQSDVIHKLDESFFRVRFDRVTHKEKQFLRAMADLGQGPYQIKEIAAQLKTTTSNLTTHRANLLKKGMIFSPSYGLLDFSVPLFDAFMQRSMPSSLK